MSTDQLAKDFQTKHKSWRDEEAKAYKRWQEEKDIGMTNDSFEKWVEQDNVRSQPS